MLFQKYMCQPPETLVNKPGVLAVVAFDRDGSTLSDVPGIIPAGPVCLSEHSAEVLEYGDQPAQRGFRDGCQWSSIDDVVCVSTWLSAADFAPVECATRDAYCRLLKLSRSLGFPHPFRMWNFIPDINRGCGDEEIYKQFCIGRQAAFDALQIGQQQFPAASAVGHQRQGATIYLLAHKRPGCHHESSRQQPAYQYPRQYGPRSPAFARATSISLQGRPQLFISGTASILGHETRAAGNLQQQITLTLDNLNHLRENFVASVAGVADQFNALRVYLRRAEDCQAAVDQLQQLCPGASLNILHADICRDNLLVEIEAACYGDKTG